MNLLHPIGSRLFYGHIYLLSIAFFLGEESYVNFETQKCYNIQNVRNAKGFECFNFWLSKLWETIKAKLFKLQMCDKFIAHLLINFPHFLARISPFFN